MRLSKNYLIENFLIISKQNLSVDLARPKNLSGPGKHERNHDENFKCKIRKNISLFDGIHSAYPAQVMKLYLFSSWQRQDLICKIGRPMWNIEKWKFINLHASAAWSPGSVRTRSRGIFKNRTLKILINRTRHWNLNRTLGLLRHTTYRISMQSFAQLFFNFHLLLPTV